MRNRSDVAFGVALLAAASAAKLTAKPSGIELALSAGDAPPREFRVFRRGVNTTDQGDFLFDDAAAKLTMAAFEAHGVDGMIDLNHLSTDSKAPNYDPDARGWYRLEVRNGELWAVMSSWTPDGAERLTTKKQRYASPWVSYEVTEDGQKRVTEIMNIALVAMPATDHAAPLVAAARRAPHAAHASLSRARLDAADGDGGGGDGSGMSQESLPAIAEAFDLDAGANIEDIIAAVSAWLKSAEDAVSSSDAPPPADGGSPVTDVDDGAAMRRMARNLLSRMGRATTIVAKAKPHDKALAAFRSSVLRETNATSTDEATLTLGTWKRSHLDLSRERKELADEKRILDERARVEILTEGVKLLAITPAKAWAKDPTGAPQVGKPSTFFSRFTLPELRTEREEWRAAKGKQTPQAPGVTVTDSVDAPTPGALAIEVTLSNGTKTLVELKSSEVERARRDLRKSLGRNPTDAQLQSRLARYALMKGNTEAKNPELAQLGKKAV